MEEAAQSPTSIDGEAPGTGMRRLPFIDGVRGLAAMVVLLGHTLFMVPSMHKPSFRDAGVADFLVWPFRFGTEMVYLFLVVSGFSLHYSEVGRRARGRAASTYREFAARRAWRIGPVYYMAIALGLVTWPLLSGFNIPGFYHHLTIGGVVSHLVFVHNERFEWNTQINGPLWSIGFEVQLYLLFPLIFWAARRWNPLLVCGGVALADLLIVTESHADRPIFGLARWFALGILLAEATARGWRVPVKVSLPIGLAALAVAGAQIDSLDQHALRHDTVWAIAFAGLLLAMIEVPVGRRNPLAWRPMRWIGLRSYSVYALHFPFVLLLIYASEKIGLTGWAASGFVTGLGVAVAVSVAVVSFRFVEGPSLKRVAAVGNQPGRGRRPVAASVPT